MTTPDCVEGARLCKVQMYPTPSGRIRLSHHPLCPARPGERIQTREYAKHRQWEGRGR